VQLALAVLAIGKSVERTESEIASAICLRIEQRRSATAPVKSGTIGPGALQVLLNIPNAPA
jgi:hypothetical protein